MIHVDQQLINEQTEDLQKHPDGMSDSDQAQNASQLPPTPLPPGQSSWTQEAEYYLSASKKWGDIALGHLVAGGILIFSILLFVGIRWIVHLWFPRLLSFKWIGRTVLFLIWISLTGTVAVSHNRRKRHFIAFGIFQCFFVTPVVIMLIIFGIQLVISRMMQP